MMNLIKTELYKLFKITLVLNITLLSMLIIFLPLYPTFYSFKESLETALLNVSSDILLAMGIDITTLFTPTGFYAFIFQYIIIVGVIFATILGTKILLFDKLSNTSEFLLTKPISRAKLLTIKIIAAVISLLITNIIFNICSITLFSIISSQDINYSLILLINISLFLIQITFASIALTIASFIKKPKAIINTSLVIVFAFYILSLIESIFNITILKYINPFSYFNAADIIINNGYKFSFIISSILIIIFCLNLSYSRYDIEDI